MGVADTLKSDVPASFVVFLVALPLCLGIAMASGAPPALGLITGIVGGLVVGLIAGSPLQVSGPAAGLAVMVWEVVQTHGLASLGVIVFLAGAMQLIAGLGGLGRWFRAISPAVIYGMLAGIGVLIFANQFHVMVDDKPKGSGLDNLGTIPSAVWKGIFPLDGSVHHMAAAIGLFTIVTLVGWNQWRPASLKSIPGALVAVVGATVIAQGLALPIATVAVPANLLDALNVPPRESLASLTDPIIWTAAAAMAVIASAESLLCASAVDSMHRGPRTDYNRELAAQGVGNLICGALGALPMTGVIVRSSANIEAGGTTRLSAILHGVWLLAVVAAAPWLLERIPTASLAAILVYTGYKLVDVKKIKEVSRFGTVDLGIYFVTLTTIVASDLLHGVIVGFATSAAWLLVKLTSLGVSAEAAADDDVWIDVRLVGAATFINLPQLAMEIENIPAGKSVRIDHRHLTYIDHAAVNLLRNWQRQHEAKGGKVISPDWEVVAAHTARGAAARDLSPPASPEAVDDPEAAA